MLCLRSIQCCDVRLCIISSLAIISLRKRKLNILHFLSYGNEIVKTRNSNVDFAKNLLIRKK